MEHWNCSKAERRKDGTHYLIVLSPGTSITARDWKLGKGYPIAGLTMPDYYAHYGPSAWLHTRELIGRELRARYDVQTDVPPQLLALVRRLCRVEASALPELPIRLQSLVMKLDELEGRELLRRWNTRD